MDPAFDPTAIVSATLTAGYWETSLELDDEFATVRFFRPKNPDALSSLTTPPSPDADTAAPTGRLRQRLCRSLGISHGPPAALIQALVATHGYRGAALRNAADGLRLLLTLPDVDDIDWSTLVSIVPSPDTSADATAVNISPEERVGRLEHDLHSLASRLESMQLNLPQQVLLAVQTALHPPTSARGAPSTVLASAASAGLTSAPIAAPPTPSPTSLPAGQAPPTQAWRQTSTHPALSVLFQVYQALSRHQEHELATQLLWVKDVVDYALTPAAQASDSDNDNVYTSKYSGRRWKTDRPPPRPCFHCGEMHWGASCPQKHAEKDSRQVFPRGKPPARYYISKGGACYDVHRRPNTPCSKCGELHWWFNCRQNGDEVRVPKGGRFVDKPTGAIRNQSSSRTKQKARIHEDGTASTSESSCSEWERAQVKRRHRGNHDQHSSHQHCRGECPPPPPVPPTVPQPPPPPPHHTWPYASHGMPAQVNFPAPPSPWPPTMGWPNGAAPQHAAPLAPAAQYSAHNPYAPLQYPPAGPSQSSAPLVSL